MKRALEPEVKIKAARNCRARPKSPVVSMPDQRIGLSASLASGSPKWRSEHRAWWACVPECGNPAQRTETPEAPQVHDAQQRDAQEAWQCVQDLWTRLSFLCQATVSREGDCCRITFAKFRHQLWCGPQLALRHAVLDTEQYRWQHEERSGSLVTLIAYESDDLVIELNALATMARWEDGESLCWQVLRFLGHYRP